MTEALLYWPPVGGSGWIVETTRPTYTATGTALATPIYYEVLPDYGYWKSRNTFFVSAPGYESKSGNAYSPQVTID